MNEQVLSLLGAVHNALNSVSVSGKDNLANLVGSMNVLEQVMELVRNDMNEKQRQDDTGEDGGKERG